MLNDVVMPLPVALAALAALALMAVLATSVDQAAAITAWQAVKPAPKRPRHRLGQVDEPYRPRNWTELSIKQAPALPAGVADYRQPLTDFERRVGVIEIPGVGVRPMTERERAATLDAITGDTRELETVA